MSSLRRILLFCLFGSCGLGIAVCLAITSDPSAKRHLVLPRPNAQNTPAVRAADEPAMVAVEPTEPSSPSSQTVDQSVAAPALLPPHPGPAQPEALPYAASPSMVRPYPPIADPAPAAEPSVPVSAMMDVLKLIKQTVAEKNERAKPAEGQKAPEPLPPQQPVPQPDEAPPSTSVNVVNEDDDTITLHMKGTEIRSVLELISQSSGMNILATPSVTGTVTASLHNVSFDTALNSILRSTGYVAVREGDIIFVGTPDEFASDGGDVPIGTRIYRPNYVTANEFQNLITSLLTPEVGTVSISTASEVGIPSDAVNAGGDSYASAEVVLVRDFEPVLKQIDEIYEDIDIRPLQVAIEAMILSVKLDDTNKLGVNFELLKDRNDVRIISGVTPVSLATVNVPPTGGLKVGFLNGNATVFVEALEAIGDTNIIATPRLLALNKQRAEILIGSQLGYVNTTQTETAATQTVEFLEVGTQLRIRPFISSDGSIRMEVHPELSTGSVRVEGGFTLPDKELTTVTTNVIAQDGSTVIIGGLIREEIANSGSQIPLFGSLPVIGGLFRQKTDKIERREILVLITPRIIYDSELNDEGSYGASEFHHRHTVRFENTTPLGKQHISHSYLLRAQHAWNVGKRNKALHYANLAIHYDPENRAAIDLRADIWDGVPVGDHTMGAPYREPVDPTNPLEGPEIDPWLLDRLDPGGSRQGAPRHPVDRGVPGPRLPITTPQPRAASAPRNQ